MAIDRGPWNALVNDDGSNLTGTLWDKNVIDTTILDPIDVALLPVYGTFTPTDTSGAGLVFGTATGTYAKIDLLVHAWIQIVYPATANGASAQIGGLPFQVSVPVGAWQGYGALRVWYCPIATATIQPHDAASITRLTNAQMSGANVILSVVYLTS